MKKIQKCSPFGIGDGSCSVCVCMSLSGITIFKNMMCRECYRREMLIDILTPETIHEQTLCSRDSQ